MSLSRESKAGWLPVFSLPPVRDYIELTKPRITWLILMSTGIGYFFGLRGAGNWGQFLRGVHLGSLLHTIVGTGLIASGTAALNQWYERDADRLMRRTSAAPVALRPGFRERRAGFGILALRGRLSWSSGWA